MSKLAFQNSQKNIKDLRSEEIPRLKERKSARSGITVEFRVEDSSVAFGIDRKDLIFRHESTAISL
ncbi:hypothetical protein HK096_007370, partial [Nowakowskiella sp. JEL0078]